MGSEPRTLGQLVVRAAATAALAMVLSACEPPAEGLYQERVLTFGTLVDISIWGAPRSLAAQASRTLAEDFNYENDAWYAWRPGALARFNQLLQTTLPFSANPSVLPLVKLSQTLSRGSEGLFNPAIGELIELWGFHRTPAPDHPPAAQAIAELVSRHPSMDDVEVDGIRVRSRNPAVKLDFGGFAKGYALDLAIAHLRRLGISNAIINAGGDLRAIGRRGDRPWRVGIRQPRGPGIMATVTVDGDESVLTSGDYERFFEYQGRRYHHILDPRTGYPATGARSVTVIHSEATTADAAATALFVAGPDSWYPLARRMGIRYVLMVDSEGTVHMNPEMAKRVHFVEKPPQIILSEPLS